MEPNIAVFSALIGAISPNHLPEEVSFILSQAEKSNVVLNSFVLLNLVRRLNKVRIDPARFTLQTRPEVLDAATCALRYAIRHDIASQPKGKAVVKQLKRLSTPTQHRQVAPASNDRGGVLDARRRRAETSKL